MSKCTKSTWNAGGIEKGTALFALGIREEAWWLGDGWNMWGAPEEAGRLDKVANVPWWLNSEEGVHYLTVHSRLYADDNTHDEWWEGKMEEAKKL